MATHATPRARLTQDRSRERRRALLEAAVDLFAEGGTRAVTSRAVAQRAGLPPATTGYYFGSVEDLVRAALERHLQGWTSAMRDLADADPAALVALTDGGAEQATALVRTVFAVRDVDLVGLQLRIYLAAVADPVLRPLAAEALDSLQQLAARLLRAGGHGSGREDDVTELAAALVALVAGSALRRQAAPDRDAEEARLLAAAVRRLLRA